MKVAFATYSGGLDDRVNAVFGRAPTFTIVDNKMNVKVIQNPAYSAPQAAGIRAAQQLVSEHVEAVVAGAFGPNASNGLSAAGIKMYSMAGIKVRDAFEQIKSGQATPGASIAPAGPGAGFGRGGGRGFGRGQGFGRGSRRWQ